MLINVSVPGMYSGVSQQAPSMRLDTQVENLINFRPNLVEGLSKRFPSAFLKTLTGSKADNNTYVHFAEDVFGPFFLLFVNDANAPVEAYTLDGEPITVSYATDTKAYILSSKAGVFNPKTDLRTITVLDTTFILNRNKTCAMLSGATLSGTYKGVKADYSKLPTTGMVDGDVWKIAGTDSNIYTQYWVKWNGTEGVWEEWGKPGIQTTIDPKTMPLRIQRASVGEFRVELNTYDQRIVGDETTNPEPSFIGSTLNNLFFYQDRLCFLSQDNMVCSRTGLYYDFWRGTVVDVLDDHPIDISVAAAVKQTPLLFDVATFDNNIVLFSTTHQFSVNQNNSYFSPRTVSVTPTTAYETYAKSNVLSAGPCIYFVTKRGLYASVREYYASSDSLVNQAIEVTSHVPAYVPLGNIKMDVSNAMDMLAFHSSEEPNVLFIYDFYWERDTKLQSAWHKWTFNDEVLNFFIDKADMYLVQKSSDGRVYLSRIDMHQYSVGSADLPVYLDKLVVVQGTYDAVENKTSFILPYTSADPSKVMFVFNKDGLPLPEVVHSSASTFQVAGDFSEGSYFAGEAYESRCRLTPLYLKSGTSGSKRAFIDGALTVRTFGMSFTNTGYFRLEVQGRDGAQTVHEFSGVISSLSRLDTPSVFTGERKFSVGSPARTMLIDLVNDSYLPVSVQSGNYEASYYPRTGRRM